MSLVCGSLVVLGSSAPTRPPAATRSTEAEGFDLPSYGTTVVRDPTAQGGAALEFYADSSATGPVYASTPFSAATLRVRATACDGFAALVVSVDRAAVTTPPVSSTSWETVRVPGAGGAGTHHIVVSMVDDLWKPGECDRNIYLDIVGLTDAPSSSSTVGSGPARPPAARIASASPPGPAVPSGTADGPVGVPADSAATARAPRPLGPSGQWSLVYNDEFTGTAVDSSKWINCYQWAVNGCTTSSNRELEWYRPQNVEESGGVLHLIARRESTRGTDGKVYPYTSAMVTTGADLARGAAARFTYRYGYVEARVKLPVGKGLWPALWCLPVSGAWPPELDVFENLGNDTTRIFMTTHWETSDQSIQGTYRGHDFSTGYHVIGLDWERSSLRWYVDSKMIFSVTNPRAIPTVPMYILLNLAVGGIWPGYPDAGTHFPAAFDVDYLRVWRRA
jgi:beta-glucanase (GH16 family)